MFLDKHGREIKHGDLLKMYHFTGARRKKFYMYKLIKQVGETLWAYSATEFATRPIDPFRYRLGLVGDKSCDYEIIEGYADDMSFDDRPKHKQEPTK